MRALGILGHVNGVRHTDRQWQACRAALDAVYSVDALRTVSACSQACKAASRWAGLCAGQGCMEPPQRLDAFDIAVSTCHHLSQPVTRQPPGGVSMWVHALACPLVSKKHSCRVLAALLSMDASMLQQRGNGTEAGREKQRSRPIMTCLAGSSAQKCRALQERGMYQTPLVAACCAAPHEVSTFQVMWAASCRGHHADVCWVKSVNDALTASPYRVSVGSATT